MCEENQVLVSKCLDFCQMLANKSMGFNFSLTMGSFSFSLDTRVVETKAADPAAMVKKKKYSPSHQRRNAKRRQLFLESKKHTESNTACTDSILVCDICDLEVNTKVDLNKHMKKAHENIEQLDGNNSLQSVSTTDEPSTETKTLCTLKDQESQTKTGPMLIKGPELQDYIDDECPEDYPGDTWDLSDDFYIDSKFYFKIKRVPEGFTRINAWTLRKDLIRR